MKALLILFLILFYPTCSNNNGHEESSRQENDFLNIMDTTNNLIIQYSDKELETFLDSVGQLPTKELLKKVWHYPDSVFENRKQRFSTT